MLDLHISHPNNNDNDDDDGGDGEGDGDDRPKNNSVHYALAIVSYRAKAHILLLSAVVYNSAELMLVWQEFIRALELALHETASPLSVAEECLRQRENRTGVDRVQDEVELVLIKVRRVGNCFYCLIVAGKPDSTMLEKQLA